MIPKRFQPVLIILTGLALLGYFAYERSDWVQLKLGVGSQVRATAKLVEKEGVGGGYRLSGNTGVVMTVEYTVDGRVFRDDLGIQNIRGGPDAVRFGRSVPIIYDARDPSRAILATDLSPEADDWALLALVVGFIGLGIAQWGSGDAGS